MKAATNALLSILLAAVVASPATAQSPVEVGKEALAFHVQYESLAYAQKNLNEIAPSLTNSEYRFVSFTLIVMLNVQHTGLLVLNNSATYGSMSNSVDAEFARGRTYKSCVTLREYATNAAKVINLSLGNVTTPAVVQEITKARDTIYQMGDSNLCKLFPEQKG